VVWACSAAILSCCSLVIQELNMREFPDAFEVLQDRLDRLSGNASKVTVAMKCVTEHSTPDATARAKAAEKQFAKLVELIAGALKNVNQQLHSLDDILCTVSPTTHHRRAPRRRGPHLGGRSRHRTALA
jgi:hypothetical protein